MGSKPKAPQQMSPEEMDRRAAELAQKESNESKASKRRNKRSTVLSSIDTNSTALGSVQKTNTGT